MSLHKACSAPPAGWASTASRDGRRALAVALVVVAHWTAPETISKGSDWFLNWADFPVLSVHGGNRVAHWLRRSSAGTYDYDIAAKFFDAARGRWGETRLINTDGIDGEHGFVSMLPMDTKRTLITWLDGRATAGGGPMTLRASISQPVPDEAHGFHARFRRQSRRRLGPMHRSAGRLRTPDNAARQAEQR